MRTKTRQILFKVDDEEYAVIRERMKECGIINMSRFLRVLATQGIIFHMDFETVRECSRLLRNISGNINQISKRVNIDGGIYTKDIDDIRAWFSEIMDKFKEVLNEFSKIHDTVNKHRK